MSSFKDAKMFCCLDLLHWFCCLFDRKWCKLPVCKFMNMAIGTDTFFWLFGSVAASNTNSRVCTNRLSVKLRANIFMLQKKWILNNFTASAHVSSSCCFLHRPEEKKCEDFCTFKHRSSLYNLVLNKTIFMLVWNIRRQIDISFLNTLESPSSCRSLEHIGMSNITFN